jgi:DnaJ-class molecular chaperone
LTPAASVRIVRIVPQNCFADEIAIDFPSAGRVVERKRDAFLGEASRGDVLATELPLTPRQAHRGLDVTLRVPIHGACPTCGGRGESWAEPCEQCLGTGESLFHHSVRVAIPAGVTDGATFRFRVTSPHTGSVRVEVRVAIQPSLV